MDSNTKINEEGNENKLEESNIKNEQQANTVPNEITKNILEYHPTVILCVPLLLEKMYQKIIKSILVLMLKMLHIVKVIVNF